MVYDVVEDVVKDVIEDVVYEVEKDIVFVWWRMLLTDSDVVEKVVFTSQMWQSM